MATNSAAINVGRLLEIKIAAGYRTVVEVDALFDRIDAEIAKLPPSVRIVTAADWRECPVMSDTGSQQVLQRIILLNARTERSSAIASPGSPTAVLQFMRLIREAGMPDRKMFFSAEEQIEWLSQVLTQPESERLRLFLAEGGRAGSSYTRVIESDTKVTMPAPRAIASSRR